MINDHGEYEVNEAEKPALDDAANILTVVIPGYAVPANLAEL